MRTQQRSAHLGGDVVRRATEGGGGHPVHDALFAHAEIRQLTVSLCVQQDVIQLQIPERERRRKLQPSGFSNRCSRWEK